MRVLSLKPTSDLVQICLYSSWTSTASREKPEPNRSVEETKCCVSASFTKKKKDMACLKQYFGDFQPSYGLSKALVFAIAKDHFRSSPHGSYLVLIGFALFEKPAFWSRSALWLTGLHRDNVLE